MASRYGRNKRRAHREQIALLEHNNVKLGEVIRGLMERGRPSGERDPQHHLNQCAHPHNSTSAGIHMCRKDITFGEAIEAIRKGHRAARKGWNGKGMFIYLVKGSVPPEMIIKPAATFDGIHVTQEHFTTGDDGTTTRLPHIAFKAASGATVTGWLASQTDMLACDWEILK